MVLKVSNGRFLRIVARRMELSQDIGKIVWGIECSEGILGLLHDMCRDKYASRIMPLATEVGALV